MTGAAKLRPVRNVAAAPERRTVSVTLAAPFDGWECVAYASFKAKLSGELMSGDVDRIVGALDRIIVTHNFPDMDDPEALAEGMGDVDVEALGAVVDAVFEAIGKLPPR